MKSKLNKILLTSICAFTLVISGCDDIPEEEKGEWDTDITTDDDTPAPHVHSFSSEWSYDEEYHWHECSCGELTSDFGAHSFTEEYIAPTCADGKIIYTCSTCGYSYEITLPATGEHVYGASTEEEGNDDTHYQECSVCGDKRYIEHDYVLDLEQTIAPTCITDGQNVYFCSECGHEKIEVTTKSSHELAKNPEYEYDDDYHWAYCQLCGEMIKEEHEWGEWYYLDYYSHGRQCKICGAYQRADHNYVYENTDRLDMGSISHHGICEECGDYVFEQCWDYEDEYYFAPTCTENGYRVYVCSRCGGYRWSTIHYTGVHDYVSEVTLEPTCEDVGIMTYTCTMCGTSYTEDIEPLGHDYVLTFDIEAGCDYQGFSHYECSRCGKVYTEATPALGHDYVYTSNNDGTHTAVCSICGDTITEAHDSLGGVSGSGDANGHYNSCSLCGEELGAYVPHNFDLDLGSDSSCAVCLDCGYELPYTYTLNDTEKTATITGVVTSFNGEWVIPAYLNEYKVTAIDNGGTYLNGLTTSTNITKLVIPYTVKSIGTRAFDCFKNSSNLTITQIDFEEKEGEGLEEIGDYAFYFTKTTTMTLPSTLKVIGEYAFYNNNTTKRLTGDLVIPDSVTTIGRSAFYQQTGLTSVKFGKGLTTLGVSSFYNCTGLTSIEFSLECGLTEIGDTAFSGTSSLTTVILPATITNIGNGAFYNARLISTVYSGSTVLDSKSNIQFNDTEYGYNNKYLEDATWYYYSEEDPTENASSYWHFVDGVPTPYEES